MYQEIKTFGNGTEHIGLYEDNGRWVCWLPQNERKREKVLAGIQASGEKDTRRKSKKKRKSKAQWQGFPKCSRCQGKPDILFDGKWQCMNCCANAGQGAE